MAALSLILGFDETHHKTQHAWDLTFLRIAFITIFVYNYFLILLFSHRMTKLVIPYGLKYFLYIEQEYEWSVLWGLISVTFDCFFMVSYFVSFHSSFLYCVERIWWHWFCLCIRWWFVSIILYPVFVVSDASFPTYLNFRQFYLPTFFVFQ